MLKKTNEVIFGAYLLFIVVDHSKMLPPFFQSNELPSGHYGYIGSAYGPGGILARCKRHFLKNKKKHWHIDWLTTDCSKLEAIAFQNINECKIVQNLLSIKGVKIAIKNFGNTDCANCSSHLVQLPTNFNKKSISFSFEEVELIHNSN
ncbi:MAG: GIY-YIG nuclease family protein [Pelagibacteraceae bacterium]|jgi:Uri superfamily endonuclease|nr:GIY-YIG nuclease family protein [Pelagibacteraceae bacterium]MBT3902645.1 GIY-YIG nuclease family protein [Pelagibacteraceae bacterium]MBT4646335.1 GIY-YIG nuclease family protein [Pelagibacteraceae bacterium]MBT4951892.1 GIY-YIG nuclease family protein [Pelagibacteraceae bacterium]MBT5213219.1 GIY-YIG nuclease family protein [Pelagibacteraceae bacterium]